MNGACDYWYENRDKLTSGQMFRCVDGSLVKLDRTVPGDGTRWYVADWNNGWSYCDSTIEPSDLVEMIHSEPQRMDE